MKYKYWILGFLCVVIGGAYFAYGRMATPVGEQKVEYTPAKKDCLEGASKPAWRACIYTPLHKEPNGDVVYFLHGRTQDESIWNDDTYYTAMIQKEWQERNVRPPTVVAVSFSPVWVLSKKGNGSQSGLLDSFLKEVIPTIEKRVGQPIRRLLMGESMGGLNTLVAGLSASGLFQKVAALCPPLYRISPFSSSAEISEFLARTGADPKTIFGVIGLAKLFIANESEWNSLSPLHLIEGDLDGRPEIYLSCGLYDKYGNFEGSQIFVDRARARGLKVQWRPLYGGHCVIDVPSVADFLIHK